MSTFALCHICLVDGHAPTLTSDPVCDLCHVLGAADTEAQAAAVDALAPAAVKLLKVFETRQGESKTAQTNTTKDS